MMDTNPKGFDVSRTPSSGEPWLSTGSLLDALSMPILLVDTAGRLIATSHAGRSFAQEQGLPLPELQTTPTYLDLCEGCGEEARAARLLARALRASIAEPDQVRYWDWPGSGNGPSYQLRVGPVEQPVAGYSILWLEKQGVEPDASGELLSFRSHLESLKTLAGGVAHDFNNLLTGMMGYADLALFSVGADSPSHRYIEQIRTGARRATDLTHRLLAYSGHGPLMLQPVSLADLVTQTLERQGEDLPAHCQLKAQLNTEVKPIRGDVEQLRLIVVELLNNAVEALRGVSGTVWIRSGEQVCQREDFARCILGSDMMPGTYAYLEISDTGCGFEPNLREKIFEPFYSTTQGRGLGLAAVLGLVLRHGGTLTAEGKPGAGALFRIYFPTGQFSPV